MAGEQLLKVQGVETYYGNIRALAGIDVEVNKGEIVSLIGANGAGKSTLMMTICGSPQARTGSITFDGRDITKMPTHEIARLRIAQSPEGRRIFPRMTVLENLQMGAGLDNLKYFHEDLEKIFVMFPRLKERQTQRGGTLSGGEQQMLSRGRAPRRAVTRPRAADRQGHLRGDQEAQRNRRPDGLPRRAERICCPQAFASRLRDGERQGDDERFRQGTSRQSRSPCRLSRRRTALIRAEGRL